MKTLTKSALLLSLQHYQNRVTLLQQVIGQQSCFCQYEWLLVRRPNSGDLLARTNNEGVPEIFVDPTDSVLVARFWREARSYELESLRDALREYEGRNRARSA